MRLATISGTEASPAVAITRTRCISPRRTRISAMRAGSFPVAERLAREGLSLPLFPGISEEQLAAVVEGVTAYFRDGL